MRWFRRHYGAHPIHLLLMLASFSLGGDALLRIRDQGGLDRILLWFAGGLILHDLIGWPLYTAVDRLLVRLLRRNRATRSDGSPRETVPWINHLRAPAFASAVLLFISFPLVLRLSAPTYSQLSGVSEDAYLGHWLAVTAVAFAGSALLYALRCWRARRTTSLGRPSE